MFHQEYGTEAAYPSGRKKASRPHWVEAMLKGAQAMSLIRFSSWHPFPGLTSELGGSREEPRTPGRTPALDAWEDESGFEVQLEVPGLTLEQVEVVVDRDQLILSGEFPAAQRENAELRRRERRSGRFERRLTLPATVDAGQVQAHLEAGVLTIRLPKVQEARPRRIPVVTSS